MRIFHIATVTDWESAKVNGSYTTSTRGRTLAEEGFIHASRGDQWQGVRVLYYTGVTEPLVLLVLDTTRLTSPVVEEAAPGSTETFPHVYGPLDVDAVVQTIPLDPTSPERPAPAEPARAADPAPVAPGSSFSRLFLEEMFRNVLVASVVLACVVAATLVGRTVEDDWGPITGAALGLGIGLLVVRLFLARRPT